MIVTFHVASGLPRAVGAADRVTMRHLQCVDGACRVVIWVDATERGAIDAGLDAADDVESATHVGPEAGGHWHVVHTTETALTAVGEGLLRADGVFTRAAAADGGWTIRSRFPDRSAVLTFREHAVGEGVDVDVRSMTEDATDETSLDFGVTEPQREMLLLALREGYFTVPRDASLSDLADVLDISSQAASERIRRGTGTLVDNTLAAPDGRRIGSRH